MFALARVVREAHDWQTFGDPSLGGLKWKFAVCPRSKVVMVTGITVFNHYSNGSPKSFDIDDVELSPWNQP